MENKFEIYKDTLLRDDLISNNAPDTSKIRLAFYESITRDNDNNLLPIYNYYKFPFNSFSNISYNDLDVDELKADTYSIKYIYLFGYYNESEGYEIYDLFNSTNNFDIPLKNWANFSDTKLTDSNFVEWIFNKSLITKNSNFSCNNCNGRTSHFMNFVKYTLKTSCLADMLMDILNKNYNFFQRDIEIIKIAQTYIYLGYVFYNEPMENRDLMNKIIEWLEENDKMNKKVDVIGDKFYYFLKGYKKIKSLKHYNMVDSAKHNTLDHLYNTHEDNNIFELNIKKYDTFIEEIKKLVYSDIPFIKIFPKNN